MSHVCEPEAWPSSTDDKWQCPECGTHYEASRAADLPAKAIRAFVLPDILGWKATRFIPAE